MIARTFLELIDFSAMTSEEIILFVDNSKGSKERKVFDEYIRLHIEARLPIRVSLDITHNRSHETPNLQAVDLFCYGILRKYAAHDDDWYNYFSKKIIKEIEWEPKI